MTIGAILRRDIPPPDLAAPAAAPSGSQVAEQLHTLIEAGADSLILMPIGPSPAYQLELAVSQVLPDLAELARQ